MPIQIDCPQCGGTLEREPRTYDEMIQTCVHCECKTGKITVYTATEMQKAVEDERGIWESFINIVRTGYVGERVYVLNPIDANRYDKAIRARST